LANGYFYGNVSVNETTTYNFNVEATDVELQNTPKTFSIQIIKPSAIFYSYQFSGSDSLWLQASNPTQDTITGNMLWSAYNKPWTWECWIKPTAGTGTRRHIYNFKYGGYRGSMYSIQLYDTNEILVEPGEQGYPFYDLDSTGSYTIPLNTWTHIAIVKQNYNNLSYSFRQHLYINGVRKRRSTEHNDYNWDYQPYGNVDIGAFWGYTSSRDSYQQNGFTGFISNMRITRNLAVYTDNFTVPTSPLGLTQSAGTNIAAIDGGNDTGRVILLTCNDSTLKDNGYYDRTASMISKNGGPAFVATSPF